MIVNRQRVQSNFFRVDLNTDVLEGRPRVKGTYRTDKFQAESDKSNSHLSPANCQGGFIQITPIRPNDTSSFEVKQHFEATALIKTTLLNSYLKSRPKDVTEYLK